MKLTLRYLLAYMDDILRPADAREVGQALHENKTASDLVQRVREVMRNRKLSAPDPLAESPTQNANTVAEYLDNLLSPEEIREFEQKCLDSDEQLAEVGACHQILTLVLGGGQTFPESTRQKLKQLAASLPAAHVGNGQPRSTGSAGKGGDHRSYSASGLPDDFVPPLELRRPRTNWKQITAALGIMVLAGAWIYSIVTDPSFQYANPGLTQRSRTVVPAEAENDQGPVVADNQQPAARSETATVAGAATIAQNDLSSNASAAPAGPQMPAGEQNLVTRIDPEAVELPPLGAENGTPSSQMPASSAEPPTTSAPPASPEAGSSAVAMTPAPGASNNANPPAGPSTEQAPAPTPPAAVVTPRQNPICMEPGIRYESDDTPLLINPEQQANAVLVADMREVQAGDYLFTPRYSRAVFSMGSRQAHWEMREKTALQVLGADNLSCLGFRIEQGRVLLNFPNPDPAAPAVILRLEIQNHHWLVELPLQPIHLAIEVVPQFATHYEQLPADGPVVATLWSSGAAFKILSHGDKITEVNGYFPLLPPATAEKPAAEGTAEMPDWVNSTDSSLTVNQKREQRDFAKTLEGSTNLWLDLQGTSSNPNPRIAEQAAELLALGQRYEALVNVLAHSPHEESRTAAISGLRSWLLRNPENKTTLQDLLKKTFNEQTAFIVYNLLWGFDEENGRDPGISRQLVTWLRHEHVAVRELAIYWIFELTGQKQGYRPLAPIGTREQGAASWERYLVRHGALIEAQPTQPAQPAQPEPAPPQPQ